MHDRLIASQHELLSKHLRPFVSSHLIGDIVFHQQHDRYSKLYPILHGPHRIPMNFHGGKFMILDLKSLSSDKRPWGPSRKKIHKGIDEFHPSFLPASSYYNFKSLTLDTHTSFRQKLRSFFLNLNLFQVSCIYIYIWLYVKVYNYIFLVTCV